MRFCNYATKRSLRQVARQAGVTIEFHDADGITRRDVAHGAALFRAADSIGLGKPAVRLLSLVSQRYMALKRA